MTSTVLPTIVGRNATEPDPGTRERIRRTTELTDSPAPGPVVKANENGAQLTVQLNCLLCVRELGLLQTATWPARGRATFRATGTTTAVIMTELTSVRCSVCGGSAVADVITQEPSRLPTPSDSIDWEADSPRSGRRPRQSS